MSSPIAIPSTNSQDERARSPNVAARSLPGNASGLYVPVHRRGASTSSSASSSPRESLSPIARPTTPRVRSVSPMPRSPRSPSGFGRHHLDVPTTFSPSSSPRSANIPLASKIPNTYTPAELLALASHPTTVFSASQRAQIDAHVPFMTRKPSKPKSSPASASSPSPSSLSSSASVSSSPTSTPNPLPAPPAQQKPNTDAQKTTRRRRPGRQNSGGKPRVAPVVGTDVEERRRQRHATWGWSAHNGNGNGHGHSSEESWRSHSVVAVA